MRLSKHKIKYRRTKNKTRTQIKKHGRTRRTRRLKHMYGGVVELPKIGRPEHGVAEIGRPEHRLLEIGRSEHGHGLPEIGRSEHGHGLPEIKPPQSILKKNFDTKNLPRIENTNYNENNANYFARRTLVRALNEAKKRAAKAAEQVNVAALRRLERLAELQRSKVLERERKILAGSQGSSGSRGQGSLGSLGSSGRGSSGSSDSRGSSVSSGLGSPGSPGSPARTFQLPSIVRTNPETHYPLNESYRGIDPNPNIYTPTKNEHKEALLLSKELFKNALKKYKKYKTLDDAHSAGVFNRDIIDDYLKEKVTLRNSITNDRSHYIYKRPLLPLETYAIIDQIRRGQMPQEQLHILFGKDAEKFDRYYVSESLA
jgi:hypothetical protein